jgi:UDP-glucose 4-epimerase
MAKPRLVLCGKNGNIGNYLDCFLRRSGFDVVSWGSKECDWRIRDQARLACKSLGEGPCTFLFLPAVNKQVKNDFESFSDNVQMIHQFIDAQNYCHNAHTVFFSSVDVYGRAPRLPISEETPLHPDSWYGFSKAVSEWTLSQYLPPAIPLTILRLPGVFGNGHHDRSVLGKWKSQIETTSRAKLCGTGKVLRDFLFVEDLGRLVKRLVENPLRETFNVASGKSLPLAEILNLVKKISKRDFKIEALPAETAREFDLVFNNKKIRSFFPDFVFTDFSQGLRMFLT